MAKTCNNCGTNGEMAVMPIAQHEKDQNRLMSIIESLIVVIIVLIVLLVGSNVGWLIYESQFETITYDYTQDGQGTNIIGDDNEVNNGAEIEGESEAQAKE